MVAVPGHTAPTRADFQRAIAARADRWFAACLKITRNPDLAEDAVQDALLSAWDKRHQFEQGARLDTWIHRIAINAALQLLRRQKPGLFVPLDIEPGDDSTSPESAREFEELDTGVTRAMRRLSDIERICFVLKHVEQWRLKEIAEELDTSVGTIKQAVFRAVHKLRADLPEFARVNP